ncbi:unnamed protein product [Urochloa humidicola]
MGVQSSNVVFFIWKLNFEIFFIDIFDQTNRSVSEAFATESTVVLLLFKVITIIFLFYPAYRVMEVGLSGHVATEHYCDREMFHRDRMLKVSLIKKRIKMRNKQGPWVIL